MRFKDLAVSQNISLKIMSNIALKSVKSQKEPNFHRIQFMSDFNSLLNVWNTWNIETIKLFNISCIPVKMWFMWFRHKPFGEHKVWGRSEWYKHSFTRIFMIFFRHIKDFVRIFQFIMVREIMHIANCTHFEQNSSVLHFLSAMNAFFPCLSQRAHSCRSSTHSMRSFL